MVSFTASRYIDRVHTLLHLLTPVNLLIFLDTTTTTTTAGHGTPAIEYAGLATAPPPGDTNTQPSGDGSYEDPVHYSGPSSPQQGPLAYDNASELNYMHI